MKRTSAWLVVAGVLLAFSSGTNAVQGQEKVTEVSAQVNKKLAKLFGAGGFKNLASYGTGILVSPKGHILTVNNHILTTSDLRVHLWDGRFYHAKVVAREPGLDVALVKIEEAVDELPYFDFDKAAAGKMREPGTWILAFSNQFQIATRDEPMSVMHGVVSAVAELRGRRGVFEAPFNGEVYFSDTIMCNPGAAGGCITDLKGELLGIIGRELKNTLTDTWINYAVPIQAATEVIRKDKVEKVNMATFVRDSINNKYIEGKKVEKQERGGYTGIVLVPNAVSATPPYVEEVRPGSPAALAGLRTDDLIVYVEGELVPTIKSYRDIMKYVAPGTEVRLDVQRREVGADMLGESKLIRIKLKVGEQPKLPNP